MTQRIGRCLVVNRFLEQVLPPLLLPPARTLPSPVRRGQSPQATDVCARHVVTASNDGAGGRGFESCRARRDAQVSGYFCFWSYSGTRSANGPASATWTGLDEADGPADGPGS